MSEPSGAEASATVAEVDATDAGLRYSTDSRPGIRRLRSGRGFVYRGVDGTRVGDDTTLARIRSIAIPPAWTEVWISTDPRGHIQATGRDARGRKQYRYHPKWRSWRDATKFDRLVAFARALPKLHRRVQRDLAARGLPRRKILAAIVRLPELTLIRVGNDKYARLNQSFGLTTLRGRHAHVSGSRVRFRFRGKGGVDHEVGIRDRQLARIVARCLDLPGQPLFQWVDEQGAATDVASDDVNDFLREAMGGDFTAKDFRTWAGTLLAYRALSESWDPPRTRPRPATTLSSPSAKRPSACATRRRFVGEATSIPPSSMPTCSAASAKRRPRGAGLRQAIPMPRSPAVRLARSPRQPPRRCRHSPRSGR